MTGEEEPIYDSNHKLIGWARGKEILYLPKSKSDTSYIDSLNNPEPKKRVGRDKGLTELMGGSFH